MNLGFRRLVCVGVVLALVGTPALARPRAGGFPVAVHATAYHGGYHGGGPWVVRGGGYRGGHGGYGGHWRHGGYWGPGLFLGALGLGIGIAALNNYPAYPVPAYPVVVIEPPPVQQAYPPSPPAAVAAPDPIIYPRNGQSATQTEADRQACNRWATTQPKAMADASVFQRATLACMEGRGYTVR